MWLQSPGVPAGVTEAYGYTLLKRMEQDSKVYARWFKEQDYHFPHSVSFSDNYSLLVERTQW